MSEQVVLKAVGRCWSAEAQVRMDSMVHFSLNGLGFRRVVTFRLGFIFFLLKGE